jgi:hypothetical protein
MFIHLRFPHLLTVAPRFLARYATVCVGTFWMNDGRSQSDHQQRPTVSQPSVYSDRGKLSLAARLLPAGSYVALRPVETKNDGRCKDRTYNPLPFRRSCTLFPHVSRSPGGECEQNSVEFHTSVGYSRLERDSTSLARLELSIRRTLRSALSSRSGPASSTL